MRLRLELVSVSELSDFESVCVSELLDSASDSAYVREVDGGGAGGGNARDVGGAARKTKGSTRIMVSSEKKPKDHTRHGQEENSNAQQ